MLTNALRLITICLALFILFLLPSCTTRQAAPEPVDSVDQTLQRSAAGAYRNGRYRQAETLYERVLDDALTRDDADEIIDARFNLALVATALGDYRAGHSHLDLADAERRRHGKPEDRQIALLRATIDYRSGQLRRASAGMALLLDAPDTDADTRNRAHFISGLIAADQSDVDALSQHIDALAQLNRDTDSADSRELAARLAGLEGDLILARQQFDLAIERRRANRDYRGMARALAACADLLADEQAATAANYYLRAGRSAAQRDGPQTRQWLRDAIEYGRDNLVLVAEAEALLAQLR